MYNRWNIIVANIKDRDFPKTQLHAFRNNFNFQSNKNMRNIK